jgi:hypothetical protein
LLRTPLLLLVALAIACGRDETPRHQEQVVDSVIPREEALRRFREGLPEVQKFEGGASSRDALLRAVAAAVAAHDTATLQSLSLSRAEFAWLYYPTATQGLPPYDLAPALYWFTTDTRSHSALAKLLEEGERGGRFVSGECGATPTTEGMNQVWGPCLLTLAPAAGTPVKRRYLSLVVEREGVWKVLQYAEGATAGQ